MDHKTTEQNIMKPQTVADRTPAGAFEMRIGNTTYVVSVHFSQTSTDTMEDKVKRLIREEAKAGNF